MANTLRGGNDQEKLQDLTSKTYKEQAIWFLNAFWNDFAEQEAANIWLWKHKFDELDIAKKDQGHELDELNAHRFLEQINSTMTVRSMRDMLRNAGVERVNYVPLALYLIARFKVDWHRLVNASQGDNQEEVARAQRMLEEVQAALREAEAREAEAKAAQAELEAALADLKAQEDAYNSRTAELTRKSEEGSVVQRNKAKNELAQHLAEDPLPLRRAKLNTEAAHRKAERAATAATQAADEVRAKFEAAQAYLNEVKNRSGSARGALWWIDRELQEAKKYLPQSKGGVAKKAV
jgi:DNA repair exonuclease SbcCD ATPase subunit